QKTAAALKEDGLLVLLWNTPPQPSNEVFQGLIDIYQAYTPDLAKYEEYTDYQKNLAQMGQEVIDSGYFRDLISEQVITQVTYSVDDYLTLLSTLSPYIRLTAQQRDTLFTQLKQRLENHYGNQLELSYLSMMQITRKN
ncbi:MAG: class I SAM-dependent methyltransferase, partial [Waterburya sp.]